MSDLAFHVRQFVPGCEGAELDQRSSLLVARDFAADLLGKVRSDRAYDYASAAHEVAGRYVFAEVPVDRLKIATSFARNLVQAAFLADHLAGEECGE